jgi:hypothetical protein
MDTLEKNYAQMIFGHSEKLLMLENKNLGSLGFFMLPNNFG